MKNIFKNSKRGIIVILTLCILLCTNGIGVHAISMPEENIAATEETTVVVEETKVATDAAVVIEETTSELMPMMARACGYGNLTSWYNINHDTKKLILGDVSGNYKAIVGNNPDIYYDSKGLIYLCGTGEYKGTTFPTKLERKWYL